MKYFEEYVSEGIVKKQYPDISRANFLIKESEKSYSSLMKIIKAMGIDDDNANTIIKTAYDIILELIRAEMLKFGYSSSGAGAHEAEVSFTRNLKLSENEVQFLDRLRYFRNSIIYYGKLLDKEYAKSVVDFLNKVYPKLKK